MNQIAKAGSQSRWPVLLASLILVFMVGYAASFEILVHPLGIKVYSVVAVFFLFMVLPIVWRQSTMVKTVLVVGLLASLLTLYLVPWNSRKVFLRSLGKIEENMLPSEVDAILGKYIKVAGVRGPSLEAYRHSDHWRYNSDVGHVYYEHGRVSKVEFSPD